MLIRLKIHSRRRRKCEMVYLPTKQKSSRACICIDWVWNAKETWKSLSIRTFSIRQFNVRNLFCCWSLCVCNYDGFYCQPFVRLLLCQVFHCIYIHRMTLGRFIPILSPQFAPLSVYSLYTHPYISMYFRSVLCMPLKEHLTCFEIE